MAITKEVTQDKLEIVGEFKKIHIRTATIIKEDGVELSRAYHRHIINPNDDSTNESADVKALVSLFHTDEVKKAFTEYLEKEES